MKEREGMIFIDNVETPIKQLREDTLINTFDNVRAQIIKNFVPEVFFVIYKDPKVLDGLFDQINKAFVDQGALVYWASELAQELRDRGIHHPGSEYKLEMC